MEQEFKASDSSPTATQPVTVDLRSYVMRLLEKERKHPDGLAVPVHGKGLGSLAWRKQKFSTPNPQT